MYANKVSNHEASQQVPTQGLHAFSSAPNVPRNRLASKVPKQGLQTRFPCKFLKQQHVFHARLSNVLFHGKVPQV